MLASEEINFAKVMSENQMSFSINQVPLCRKPNYDQMTHSYLFLQDTIFKLPNSKRPDLRLDYRTITGFRIGMIPFSSYP